MYISMDLDDTLLRKDKSVSDKTKEVLSSLQKLGHKIIINTARNFVRTKELIDLLKPDFTVINAGGYILDKDLKPIKDKTMPKELTNAIVMETYQYTKNISIQTKDYLYTTDPNSPYMHDTYYDISNGCYLESYKILPCNLPMEIGEEIAKKNGVYFVNYFGGKWSRFAETDATKLEALKYIVAYDGGSMNDTISFGDDYGDISMITGSGIGVAMENALEDVKKKAPNICLSNENDGVARFLDNYFKLNIYGDK